MKAYLISSPEELKEAARNMKWQAEQRKTMNLAIAWSATIRKEPERVIPFRVTMEVGRSAILFRANNNGENKTQLGTVNLKAARAMAKELVEV